MKKKKKQKAQKNKKPPKNYVEIGKQIILEDINILRGLE